MHSFNYKHGSLHCEQVGIESIAESAGTPVYVYSKATMLDHYRRLKNGLSELDLMVCYAVKACSNIAVLNLFAREGSGFDIVSGGELYRVIKAGGNPGLCTFAGVGKTPKEIRFALEQGIYSFNVESEAELRMINEIAGQLGVKAPIALRVNPNVDAKTHKYITTGTQENKFGIDFELVEGVYEIAASLPNIHVKGVQMHIGSQLTTLNPFVEAVRKVAPLALRLKEKYGISYFSIGGGIGIVYPASLESGAPEWWQGEGKEVFPLTMEEYAAELLPLLKPLGLRIIIEPGRLIVGNAGVLVTRCLYEKKGLSKTFKIVDSGFNDLIRPALYEGYHQIVPITQPEDGCKETVDVVGPICETGDFFAQDREIGCVEQGGLLALLSAGAYGFSMSSNYNSRPMAVEVLVDGDRYDVIRKRQTWDDIIAGEHIPGQD